MGDDDGFEEEVLVMPNQALQSTVAQLAVAGVLIVSVGIVGCRPENHGEPAKRMQKTINEGSVNQDESLRSPIDATPIGEVSAANPAEIESDENPINSGYDNGTNRLQEKLLQVTDESGEPAVRGFTADVGFDSKTKMAAVKWEIVWTMETEYSWNYRHAKLFDENEFFAEEYPSPAVFLEKKAGAKVALSVAIPDTPYSIEIVNGQLTTYIFDSRKHVFWRLNSPEIEKAIRSMRSISPSSKRLVFPASGGDVGTFLIIDFSNPRSSPVVEYYSTFYGP